MCVLGTSKLLTFAFLGVLLNPQQEDVSILNSWKVSYAEASHQSRFNFPGDSERSLLRMSSAALSGMWTTNCRILRMLGFVGRRSFVRRTLMVMDSQMGKSWGIPAACGMRYNPVDFRNYWMCRSQHFQCFLQMMRKNEQKLLSEMGSNI